MNKQKGCVYIVHEDKPLMRGTAPDGTPLQAGHYTGFAEDLLGRLFKHYDGLGSRFTKVCVLRGVQFSLGRVWEDVDREFERKVKDYKNAPTLCTICNPDALKYLSESQYGS